MQPLVGKIIDGLDFRVEKPSLDLRCKMQPPLEHQSDAPTGLHITEAAFSQTMHLLAVSPVKVGTRLILVALGCAGFYHL